METISLIRELNKSTIKKDEFERALAESGFDLPPEEEYTDEPDDMEDGMEDGMDIEDPEATLDSEEDDGFEDIASPLEENELEDIVNWCEKECGDMEDDELTNTLRDELDELELSEDELDATITQVMSMLGRETAEEVDNDEFSDEADIDIDIEMDADPEASTPEDDDLQF